MDFKYLIEKGTYSKDNLKPKQKAFISGLEQAKETVESYKYNIDCYFDCDIPVIKQMLKEVAEKVIEDLADYLDAEIAQHIVVMEDENIVRKERRCKDCKHSRKIADKCYQCTATEYDTEAHSCFVPKE